MAAENCHSVNSFSIQTGVLIETVKVFFVENLDSHAKCCTIVTNIESSFEESRASRAVISHAQHVPHANLNSIAQQKPFCLLFIICNEGCLCGQSISVRERGHKSDIHTCSYIVPLWMYQLGSHALSPESVAMWRLSELWRLLMYAELHWLPPTNWEINKLKSNERTTW